MNQAGRVGMMRGGAKWKNPYITDGLVAMWDGEWNAGPGVHDPNATTWKDLAGSYDMTIVANGGVWEENCLSLGSASVSGMKTYCDNTININDSTLEVVGKSWFRLYDKQIGFYFSSAGNKGFLWFISLTGDYYYGQFAMYGKVAFLSKTAVNNVQSISGVVSNTTCSRAYVNGIQQQSDYQENWGGSSKIGFGRYNYSQSDRIPQGKWYQVRIYSRALTAAEVAANYAVDKARFNLP